MNHKNVTMKRLTLYIGGLFFLTLGVSLSIQAGLGVSPVSSLAYALVLTSGLSIGITTVLANILFILVQIILSKRMDIKDLMLQLIISVVFGFFMDATLFLVQLLPTPESIVLRCVYLIISLFVVSAGLIGYFTAKLPLMPYDALTYVISEQFKIKFSKAKITGDLINVFVANIYNGFSFYTVLWSNWYRYYSCRLFYRKNIGVDDITLSRTSATVGKSK